MEFSSSKSELQRGVSAVEKIVSTRSTLPIIGNLLFEAGKNGVKLAANNLEIGIEIEIKAKVVKEGAILLPAKTISGIVTRLPERPIDFKLGEKGTVRISYEQSHFDIHSLPPDEFPSLPKMKEGKTFTVGSEVFLSLVKQTIFAVSVSEEKYVLTGVLMEAGRPVGKEGSNLRLIATDGYRLAKRGVKVGLGGLEGASAIIPARALTELVRILERKEAEEIKISISTDQVSFCYANVYLVSRLIQGQFPDYEQVIPKKTGARLVLSTREFLEAAERAAVVASGSANVTRFEVRNGKMHILASTPDVGSVDEMLEVEVKGEGKATAAFNVRQVIDVLKVVTTEKVILELSEGLSPGVIRPDAGEDFLYIVMPIRTQETA